MSLKNQLLKLGSENPSLRNDIRAVVAGMEKTAIKSKLDRRFSKLTLHGVEREAIILIANIAADYVTKTTRFTAKADVFSSRTVDVVVSLDDAAAETYDWHEVNFGIHIHDRVVISDGARIMKFADTADIQTLGVDLGKRINKKLSGLFLSHS